MIPKLWTVNQLIVGHETDKLTADKENMSSPMETETEQHRCAYTQAGEYALIHFEGQAGENAKLLEWS